MIIRNDEDLRRAYMLLSTFKEGGKEGHPKVGELKKRIRSYLHLPHCSRVIRDDGIDGYVELMQLPEFLDSETKEEAAEWFEKECYIEPTRSAHDCTGKPFTNWYKVFRRRGHWFAYHSVGFDV